MIKIISEFEDYCYYSKNEKISKSGIRETVQIPVSEGWDTMQLIGFNDSNMNYVLMDISGLSHETIKQPLYWQNFSNEDISLISEIFQLKVVQASNISTGNNLIALINNRNFQGYADLAMKKMNIDNNNFIIIFNLNHPDRSATKALYIHGIWQVELSEEFKAKICH